MNITRESTDNPNVMRFVTDITLNPTAPIALYDSAGAANDPFGAELFAIDGVAGVMVINEFCAVHKRPDMKWATLTPQIEAVMRRHWDT